jgi:hypothetical protein
MDKPESYEVTEYGSKKTKEFDKYSVIVQIVQEKVRDVPSLGLQVSFTGDLMRIAYHCYEMNLPSKMKTVQEQANTYLNEAVKHIKKEFKSRTKKPLTLKEKKDLANYTVQKVSLNERFYVVYWRFYEIE